MSALLLFSSCREQRISFISDTLFVFVDGGIYLSIRLSGALDSWCWAHDLETRDLSQKKSEFCCHFFPPLGHIRQKPFVQLHRHEESIHHYTVVQAGVTHRSWLDLVSLNWSQQECCIHLSEHADLCLAWTCVLLADFNRNQITNQWSRATRRDRILSVHPLFFILSSVCKSEGKRDQRKNDNGNRGNERREESREKGRELRVRGRERK